MEITPRILKGFRDFLPPAEIRRKELVRILEDSFRSFGFVPIDTPLLEYAEVLLGKGGGETDKQVYRFNDHGGRDVALRFDLTVPFARYMAMHRNELNLPFKRFHINKVFRGENTQRGRYREFTQCDFDIVGTDSVSADLEIVLMITSAFAALQIPGVTVHISHRGIFNRFLQAHQVQDQSVEILRTVDKLRKVGEEETLQTLQTLTSPEIAGKTLAFIGASGSFQEILTTLESLAGGPCPESQTLREIGTALETLVTPGTVILDPSITRGLDYYTGVVFETFLKGAEGIGSVCSGGRYDDLVSLYSKEAMPGVGASIGLDRLLAGLEELGQLPGTTAAADVLITMQDAALTAHYHELGQRLRARGIRCEVYPEAQKLGRQFAFAERKEIPLALVCGLREHQDGTVNLRILETRENHQDLTEEQALEIIHGLLPR
ncbi:histidine--tRNA ligase [Alkalispirochaeta sphaeroplastigenens]|uniref:Histidine--tRNA ligase n=1 Tax=Alkalispirochaeta sphaeroplastigenens TaxID=1187066 RepID=A0A2S4JQQ9_9SPIO|nr:histidine--tRNA ligase [Alkalispirochaeta sphaeroplastigenens]POR01810.1 histidine--tRNA ligase [Alkalispirochaeta sphaeroplastigenens]